MPKIDVAELTAALALRERHFMGAIDRLCELAPAESENEACELARSLREAVELVRCLRRLAHGRTLDELHRAFGAPGDFGYETPIGAALARVYGLLVGTGT